jgi:hypothetical protein
MQDPAECDDGKVYKSLLGALAKLHLSGKIKVHIKLASKI